MTAVLPLFLAAAILLLPRPGLAGDLPGDGYQQITAPSLKEMMDLDPAVMVINVLSPMEFAIQHITGSVNIPISRIISSDPLPADKDIPLVFHCLSDR